MTDRCLPIYVFRHRLFHNDDRVLDLGAGTSDSSSHVQIENLLFPTMLERRPVVVYVQRPEYVDGYFYSFIGR